MERHREAIMAAARAQLVASKGRRAEVFDDLEIRARVNGVEREYRLSDAPDSVVMAASSGTRSHGHATVMGMRPTFKHSKQAEAAVGFVSRRFGDGARWADIPERHREGIVDARVERMVSIEHGVVHINTRAEETAQLAHVASWAVPATHWTSPTIRAGCGLRTRPTRGRSPPPSPRMPPATAASRSHCRSAGRVRSAHSTAKSGRAA